MERIIPPSADRDIKCICCESGWEVIFTGVGPHCYCHVDDVRFLGHPPPPLPLPLRTSLAAPFGIVILDQKSRFCVISIGLYRYLEETCTYTD